MKKLLLVLGVLAVSSLGFAGAKEDYENARKLASQNKTTEAIKVLQNLSKSTEKEYATIANLELGSYYLGQNQVATAKKHLLEIWKNQTPVTNELAEAARLLYLVSLAEKNTVEAEKYIKWADDQTKGLNSDVTSSLIIFYYDNNMKPKGDTRYNTAMKVTDKAYVSDVSYNVGQYFLAKNQPANAKKYFQTSYNNSTTPNAKISVAYSLAEIAMFEKNNAEAEKYLLEMEKVNKNDTRVLGVLGEFYLNTGNETKAIDYLKRSAAADSKNATSRLLLLAIYETKGNTAEADKVYNQLKTLSNSANKQIGLYFAQMGSAPLAEKYLKKSISEQKDNESKVILGQVYAAIGKKAEGIALLKEAVAAKVQGASEILKQVEAMK